MNENFTTYTLEELYSYMSSFAPDLSSHLPKLRELASQYEHITEFGLREGASTVAFLAAQPGVLRSYDRNVSSVVSTLKRLQGKTDFQFIQADVLTVDIEPTDLLFIDTRHTAHQLATELNRHANKVSGHIVFHDTSTFGEIGEDGGPGLLVALREFLSKHPEWLSVYQTPDMHGLTAIRRGRYAPKQS